MLIEDIKLTDRLDFSLYTNTFIPTEFKGVTVLAIVDYDTARLWIDPVSAHQNIYPSLPAGSLNDPTKYSYLKLRLMNGEVAVVGLPWIREETLQYNGRSTLQLLIEDVTPEDIPAITKAIAAVGKKVTSSELI